MAALVSLPCPRCDRAPHRPWSRNRPEWAAVTGTAHLQWSDLVLPPAGVPTEGPSHWERLEPRPTVEREAAGGGPFLAESAPRPGEEKAVMVNGPFLADGPFWALFRPARAEADGFDEYPELLRDCAMIACTPLEILDQSGGRAWVRVRAENVIRVTEAADRFAPSTAGSLAFLLQESSGRPVRRTALGGLSHYAWSAQGDIGAWAICTEDDQGIAVVLYGEWDFDSDDVALGHRTLLPAEATALRTPRSRPRPRTPEP